MADTTRTDLADGGYVLSYRDGSNFHVQKYDAQGQAVGSEFVTYAYGITPSVTALSNGGYVAVTGSASAYGASMTASVFDAAANKLAQVAPTVHDMGHDSATGWTTNSGGIGSVVAAPSGGFLITSWEAITADGGPYIQNARQQLTLYDNSGAVLAPTTDFTGSSTTVSLQDGKFLVDIHDGTLDHRLTIDPTAPPVFTTPATPTVQVFDDASGTLRPAASGLDDITPVARVAVNQVGYITVEQNDLGHVEPVAVDGGVAVTAADVARGYLDVTLPAGASLAPQTYWIHFKTLDGVISAPARASGGTGVPEIVSASGDEGAIARGGATHDSTPTLRLTVHDSLAHAGDAVAIADGGTQASTKYVLSADDVSRGYVDLTTSALSAGAHELHSLWFYAAGSSRISSSSYAVDVQAAGAGGDTQTGGDGQAYHSPQPGSVETGGAGADTFYASQGLDTLSGAGGADLFVFQTEPWAPIHITDFQVGTDKLDLSALFQANGYSGSDPVADGWIYLQSDGADGTIVRFDRDGTGGNPQWPNTIIDLEHVAPGGLTWAQLAATGGSTGGGDAGGGDAGGGDTQTGGDTAGGTAGQVFVSSGPSSTAVGTAGADTFYASQGNDTLTGAGGADVFAFQSEPWAPIHITDFTVGTDKLDLSALFQANGYSGSDPVADGWIYLQSDGAGGTIVRFDHDGGGPNPQWPNTIIDLEHVSTAGLTWSQLSVAAGGSTGGGSTGGGDTGGGDAGGGGTGGGDTQTGGDTTGGTAGQMFLSPAPHATSVGAGGADTFYASQGDDTLTGAAGTDLFVFTREPWSPDHITDFQVGVDKLDLNVLFRQFGYGGSDPVADGWVHLQSDGAGGTAVRFDHDGPGPDPQFPNTIIDLEGVSPTGLTWAQLSVAPTGGGSAGPGGSGTRGVVITSPDAWMNLTGTAGDDTIIASQGFDTLTGGGGADLFELPTEPWGAVSITDFAPGQDKLDFRSLFQSVGYHGTNPAADGYISVADDGNGGALIRFDRDGAGQGQPWPNTIIDLEHVAPGQVSASDWIIS